MIDVKRARTLYEAELPRLAVCAYPARPDVTPASPPPGAPVGRPGRPALAVTAEGQVMPVLEGLPETEHAARVALAADLEARLPEAQATPGEHCQGCDARGCCPAAATLVGAILRPHPELLTRGVMPYGTTPFAQSPEHADQLRREVPVVEAWLARAKDSLRRYLAPAPIEARRR